MYTSETAESSVTVTPNVWLFGKSSKEGPYLSIFIDWCWVSTIVTVLLLLVTALPHLSRA